MDAQMDAQMDAKKDAKKDAEITANVFLFSQFLEDITGAFTGNHDWKKFWTIWVEYDHNAAQILDMNIEEKNRLNVFDYKLRDWINIIDGKRTLSATLREMTLAQKNVKFFRIRSDKTLEGGYHVSQNSYIYGLNYESWVGWNEETKKIAVYLFNDELKTEYEIDQTTNKFAQMDLIDLLKIPQNKDFLDRLSYYIVHFPKLIPAEEAVLSPDQKEKYLDYLKSANELDEFLTENKRIHLQQVFFQTDLH